MRVFLSDINSIVSELRNKIIRRGDLPHVTIEIQIEYLKQLTQFSLGRSLLQNKVIDSKWTDYIMVQEVKNQPKGNFVENFIENKSPFIKSWIEVYHIFQNITKKSLRNHLTIASIPCGVMRDLLSISYNNFQNITLVGIDIDREVLEQAKQLSKELNTSSRVRFVCKDAWNLQISEKYDIISSCGLNIYLSEKNLCKKLYHEFYQALKPGGFLMISFLCSQDFSERREMKQVELLKIDQIIFDDILELKCRNFISPEEFQDELLEVGFKEIKFYFDRNKLFPVALAYK